jgi:hypothetical protein
MTQSNVTQAKDRLKEVGLQLCTCTWIEIMTGAGLTMYLAFVLHNYFLAALTSGLFAPLIIFHFAITLVSRRDGLIKIDDNRAKK